MRGRRIPIADRGPGHSYRPSFDPRHQPGIATSQLDHVAFGAFDLPTAPLAAWWDAAARLMRSGVTVTLGLGPGWFRGARRAARPVALRELPAFRGDALEPARGGGDLCAQVCAADASLAAGALDELAELATLRWTVQGFLPRDPGDDPRGRPRDLLGFKSGTANPSRGRDLDRHVWAGRGERTWMAGGTFLVVRTIRIDLAAWRALPVAAQERVIGRHQGSGAPLGAQREFDPLPAEPAGTHARLASREANGGITMLRRSYSTEDGLLFLAFMRDPARQYVPVQRRLAQQDPLSAYIQHVGSAIFAIPPPEAKEGPLADEASTWEGEEGRKRASSGPSPVIGTPRRVL
jgi:deferrochelatase/peroxidase EfeB